jgi:hypothetical protein
LFNYFIVLPYSLAENKCFIITYHQIQSNFLSKYGNQPVLKVLN